MEETVTSKQFDVCQTLCHSVQSATLVQTLMQLKIKLFRVGINVTVICNSQLFLEIGHLTIKYQTENSTVIIELLNINNPNSTLKSTYLNMEEWTNKFFQEVWKDCAISIQQKCKLHKPGRPNINFDEIALNFENHVPNTTSI